MEDQANILMVDDLEANLVALRAVLEPLGHRLVAVASGAEALRRLLLEDFDCILLDVQMPGLDGFETAKLIKGADRTRHVPLMFLTAIHREEAGILRGYTAGAVDYVLKPFDPDLLRAKVSSFVALHLETKRREAALKRREREEGEARVEAAQERYRTFVRQSREGIWRIELEVPVPQNAPADEQLERFFQHGVFAEANDAMARMYGFEHASDLVGVRLGQLLVRTDERNIMFLRAFVASGYRLEDAESHETDRHGAHRVFQNSLVGVVEDGLLIRAWGTQRDVTAQVEAREQAEALAERLRQSEEQFRTLADSISQLAWIAEPDGSVYWYNRRWYEYTGTTPEQMMEQEGFGWKRVHDPVELVRILPRFEAAIASGTPWEDTFPLRSKDGEFRWHLSRAMPVRDAQGRIVRWFGTNTDVEDQRRQAAELREAVEVRDTFLSIASHELKTPLTPLALRLSQMKRDALAAADPVTREKDVRNLEIAEKQVRKLSALVGGLLDVSRLVAGRLQLQMEPVDLGELVREVAARFEPEAAKAGCALELRLQPGVVGQFDRMRMEQVITNLLTNALKYGAGKPVSMRLEAKDGRAKLVVKDEGIGIEPAALLRIFGKFERAVSEQHYGGLGLGLYVTKQIVEAMGGSVKAESIAGKGATFTVDLVLGGTDVLTPTA